MGVIKLHEAPKQMATKNGRGSTCNMEANIIPMGVIIIATAALEIKADSTKVTPYKTVNIMIHGVELTQPDNQKIALTILV